MFHPIKRELAIKDIRKQETLGSENIGRVSFILRHKDAAHANRDLTYEYAHACCPVHAHSSGDIVDQLTYERCEHHEEAEG